MDQISIVAFACENKKGEVGFIYPEQPVLLGDIKMIGESLCIQNIVIHSNWYDSITICTQEILDLFKQTLQIA